MHPFKPYGRRHLTARTLPRATPRHRMRNHKCVTLPMQSASRCFAHHREARGPRGSCSNVGSHRPTHPAATASATASSTRSESVGAGYTHALLQLANLRPHNTRQGPKGKQQRTSTVHKYCGAEHAPTRPLHKSSAYMYTECAIPNNAGESESLYRHCIIQPLPTQRVGLCTHQYGVGQLRASNCYLWRSAATAHVICHLDCLRARYLRCRHPRPHQSTTDPHLRRDEQPRCPSQAKVHFIPDAHPAVPHQQPPRPAACTRPGAPIRYSGIRHSHCYCHSPWYCACYCHHYLHDRLLKTSDMVLLSFMSRLPPMPPSGCCWPGCCWPCWPCWPGNCCSW